MKRPLRAVYRLQLSPEQDFGAVLGLVPYLRDLGVSHLYLSPVLQARAGSTHGYDVVDPTRVSDALGGEEGLRELAAAGLGIVLDVVPNHMGIGEENRWWSDPELRPAVFDYDPSDGWYRRFFDIDDLAGVRVEDPEVFALTHGKVLELVRDGVVDGLRIDHPDGLADPATYLRRLREEGVQDVWVEKILSAAEPVETLPDWPVAGTVGYEFLADVTALFVDPAGEEPLGRLAEEITGEDRAFREIALEAQIEQATTTFAREVERLRELLDVPSLAETLAALPVYRTYADPASGAVSAADRQAIDAAGAPDPLRRALLLEDPGHDEFVVRFQQTSPPVTAKGVEDTAFYRDVRLLALNEVGSDPARFSLTVEDFHQRNRERARRFPRGLLTTQTHDTKRSGDVRARIGALAGMAAEWREHVLRWRASAAGLRERDHNESGDVGDGAADRRAPDPAEEYLLYQTLVGAWPIDDERLTGYLTKALREAKRATSWAAPDEAWEGAVRRFAVTLLRHPPFLADFEPFAARVARAGRRAALAQLLLKLTAPGVPDLYQGDELEALSLVDPDNRRPVDWDRRRALLARLRAGAAPDAQTAKMDLVVRALDLRRRRPEPFDDGAYVPVPAGPDVCAFARGGAVLVAVAVREARDATLGMPADLWGTWRSVLDDRTLPIGADVPVERVLDGRGLALLERDPGGEARP